MSEDDQTTWRRSSAPLLNSWENIPGLVTLSLQQIELYQFLFSLQDTLSVSSSFSHSNRSRSDETSRPELSYHKEAQVTTPSTHYFGWDKGIVKLRKSLKFNSNATAKQAVFARDSSDTDGEMTGSVRDSGETVVEDLL